MKKLLFIFSFILLCPLMLFGCGGEETELSSYEIKISYDEETQTANGFESVTYVNSSENALESLCFHLYPNAFREESKHKVVALSAYEKAYPNGVSFGNIEIESVKIRQSDAKFAIAGDDENILEVYLPSPLYPDENVTIDIDFFLNLPNINHRFGYGNSAINFANFYPIACVYEDGKGFIKDPYSSNGDPFYSDTANYEVTISYDKKFTLASSGESAISSENEDNISSIIVAKNIRDFAFVLSEKFELLTEKVGDTEIRYYYYHDSDPEKSLNTAVDALSTFNLLYGSYPYSQLSVVETNFVHGGMEYPNLVMISDAVTDHGEYEYVIVHEIAHQWWYGVVGNNEYDEAWLDESLTDYSAAVFYQENKDYGLGYDEIIKNATSSYKFFLNVYGKIYDEVDTSMTRSLDEFKTEPEYVNLIYTKGVIMFDTIRQQIGDTKFFKALQKYFKTYAFKNATGDQLIEIFEDVCGHKMEELFKSWLSGEAAVI